MGLRSFVPPPTALFAAGAVAVFSYAYQSPAPPPQITSAEPGAAEEREVEESYLIEIPIASDYSARLSEMIDRPLFVETRRPFAAPEPEPIEVIEVVVAIEEPALEEPEPTIVEPTFPELTYLGFLTTDGKKQALLSLPEVGEEIWVGENAVIEGWRVTSIAHNQVSFEQNGFHRIVIQRD